jgi:hypothetical protein
MKKLEFFLPRVLPWCLGAPEPLVYQALIDSAIQFCDESSVTTYITDPITVIANVPEYEIDLPVGMDLARIMRVWYGEGPWDAPTGGGPINWRMIDLDQLTIYPTPTQALPPGQFMFIEVATKPSRNASSLDDRLYSNWMEGIVGGAIQRLCSTPDQPYTNPTNAAIGARMFTVWRGKAQYESTKGRVRRDTAVRMRPFA